jgi:hypothetical protein
MRKRVKASNLKQDLLRPLTDRSPEVRIRAIERLGSHLNKPVPELTVMLNDRNLVRSYAAFALGNSGRSSGVRFSQEALERERSSQAKVGLHAALFVLGDRKQLALLLAAKSSIEGALKRISR